MSRYNIIDKKTTEYKFPETYSSILQETKTNDITINGVNVITKTPSVGDILCITRNKTSNNTLAGPESQDIIWIKGNTFNFDSFRGDLYEPVGVVYNVIGRTAYVAYRKHTTCSFADVRVYELEIPDELMLQKSLYITLYYIDENGENQYILGNADKGLEIIYSSKKDFIKQIQIALLNTLWSVQYIDGLCLLYVPYIDYQHIFFKDITINKKTYKINCNGKQCAGITECARNICKVRETNNFVFGGGVDLKGTVEHWSIDGDGELSGLFGNIYKIGYKSNKPVNYTSFTQNTDDCKLLRDTFVTYENYIKEVEMLEWPHANDDAIGKSFGKGKKWTNILSQYDYTPTTTSLMTWKVYRTVEYCSKISINHTKLVEGNWFMPVMSDIYMMVKNNDIISDTINRLNNSGGIDSGFKFNEINKYSVNYWTINYFQQSNDLAYVWCYTGHSFIAFKCIPSEEHEVIPVIQIDF